MSFNIDIEDINLLIELLAESGTIDSDQDRRGLFKRCVPNAEVAYFQFDGTAITWATHFIHDHNTLSVLRAVLRELERSTIKRTRSSELERIKLALEPQRIHILTSVKGGVGKTLAALSAACTYYFNAFPVAKGETRRRPRGLICIDANNMNPDYSRILSTFGQNQTMQALPDVSGWDRDQLNTDIHLLRPTESFVLPDGANGFWRSIVEIASHPDYPPDKFDIVVDTSLHVANVANDGSGLLMALKSEPSLYEAINAHIDELPLAQKDRFRILLFDTTNILSDFLSSGRTVYIWIFWTWAAFQDIKPIKDALEFFGRSEFRDKISFVHVLNPSALRHPRIKSVSANEILDAVAPLDAAALGPLDPMDEEELEDIRQRYIQLVNRLIQKRTTLEVEPIPGLDSLAGADTRPPISFIDFENKVASLFRDVDADTPPENVYRALYNLMMKEYNGRPLNILPISKDDPNLTGYTELFARQNPANLEELRDTIKHVLQDLSVYLGRF